MPSLKRKRKCTWLMWLWAISPKSLRRLEEVWQEVSDGTVWLSNAKLQPRPATLPATPDDLVGHDAVLRSLLTSAMLLPMASANNDAIVSKLRLVSSSRIVTALVTMPTALPPRCQRRPTTRGSATRYVSLKAKKVTWLSSRETLRRLALPRKLLQQLVPDPGDVRVVQLKFAQAINVRRQLEEMIGATSAAGGSKFKIGHRQNRRCELKLTVGPIALIIQHCTARQLELINQYIPVLDQGHLPIRTA